MRRNDNGNDIRINLLDATLELDSIHSRHFDVQQDNVPGTLLKLLQRAGRFVGGIHPVTIGFEPLIQGIPYRGFIVNDQYSYLFRLHTGYLLLIIS